MSGEAESDADFWLEMQAQVQQTNRCIYCGDIFAEGRPRGKYDCEQCLHLHFLVTRADFLSWINQKIARPFTYWNPLTLASQLLLLDRERPKDGVDVE